MFYAPDYSIAANKRLIKQKGLFLISGSEERVATKNYHKIMIDKQAKKTILEQLKTNIYAVPKCPWRKKKCKICSCKNGFSFATVYGDLFGQAKAIEFSEKKS